MRTAIYSIQSMKGLQVCDQQVHCVCVDVPQSKAHSRHTPHLCRGLLIRVCRFPRGCVSAKMLSKSFQNCQTGQPSCIIISCGKLRGHFEVLAVQYKIASQCFVFCEGCAYCVCALRHCLVCLWAIKGLGCETFHQRRCLNSEGSWCW